MKSELVVPESLDGARLDKAAVELAKGLSRAKVKRAIDAGEVRVNGKRRAKGSIVAKGDVIAIEGDASAAGDDAAIADPDLKLDVRFASEAVLVVNKPAGQPTAPLRPREKGTLANALVATHPELAGLGYSAREPGLLHRLDTDTSGLLIAARTADAFDTLKRALKEGHIAKSYLLLCASDGLADEGTIAHPLASHPKDQRRVMACIHPRDVIRYAPRPASTDFRVIKRVGAWALVEANVSRALRHQIRAHFGSIEHPLAGDSLYGGPVIEGLGRHALHASRVAFGGGGERALTFDVRSELPEELQKIVD